MTSSRIKPRNPVHFALKAARRVAKRLQGKQLTIRPDCEKNADVAATRLQDLIHSGNPGMVARFGSTEMITLENYLGVRSGRKDWFGFVSGRSPAWWWNDNILDQMQRWSGFFPPTESAVSRFCELMLRDIPLVDVLGSWLAQERLFQNELSNATFVDLELLNPFFSKIPWTRALEGKRVLVIHPFASTIEAQYPRRDSIFPNGVLPEFELSTIKAVQSLGGESTGFQDWFAALDSMIAKMEEIPFDVCLIGCGAYGFPLAAHAKRMGKVGIHIGGSLQLFFGIRGKRWENPEYNDIYNYSQFMNSHWVKPGDEERPKSAEKVEGACYW